MICPNCQHNNPEKSGFCLNCGVRIAHFCSYCGNFLPLPANYCNRCGHAQRPAGDGYLSDPAIGFTQEKDDKATGTRVPPEAASLKQAEDDHPLHQYIPKELLGKLESARLSGGMAGERRVITMLFCDLKGSTAASEQLDPEEWTEIINGAFEHMIRPVYDYEGTVARLMGDGVLAFFGAPIAHEDDPQRAVLAGLDIVEGILGYRQEVQERWGIKLDVRVGINTGMVVVGTVGSDLRLEYTAMGDAINLAARMEQTARPGTVQIAQDTYKAVKSTFEVEDLGGIQVKGKEKDVPAYRVLGRLVQVGRLPETVDSHVDLVGREEEIAILEDVLSGLSQGVGQIVCLVGEAGLGKSRLVAETRALVQDVSQNGQAVEGSTIDWYETGSLSFETSNPYGLFQRLIRRENGIAANDPAPIVREKLMPLLEYVKVDQQERVEQVLETLFGVTGEDGVPPLSGETFKRLLFEAMVDLWQGRFDNKPTVLVFDDLHWSDPASIDLLLHLYPLVEKTPLLLFCVFRPDRAAPAWQLKLTADAEYHHLYNEIQLKPLSEAQCDELVHRLLPHSDLPDVLRKGIWERSVGNPFFVEEVIRSLKDNDMLLAEERNFSGERRLVWYAPGNVTTFDIPDNLQALLAARVDRLEEDVRQTLQLASVIGRTFGHRLVAAVAANGSANHHDLQPQLSALLRIGMIQVAARVPEVEYKFNNPLTQEVVYNTILLKKRREFHLEVGQAIEKQFPDRLSEWVMELGYHYGQAHEYSRAFHYYSLAGDNAARLFANADAARYYGRAVAYAEHVDLDSPDLARLYIRLGRVFELDNQYDEALANYERLAELGRERQDQVLKLAALVACATLYATQTQFFDTVLAETVTLEALALASELEDKAAESKILWIMMMRELNMVDGDHHKAVDFGEQSLIIAREQNLREQMAYSLNNLVPAYWHIGKPGLAQETGQEADSLWQELGNLPMRADVNNLMVLAYGLTGDYDAALATGSIGYEIGKSLNNPWGMSGSLINSGLAYLDIGQFGRAMDCFTELRQVSELSGSTFLIGTSGMAFCRIYRAIGAYDLAVQDCLTLLADVNDIPASVRQLIYFQLARNYAYQGELKLADEALDKGTAEAKSDAFFRVYLPREDLVARAEIALAGKQYAQALTVIEGHITQVNSYGARAFMAEPLYLKSRALLGEEQVEKAYETLLTARSEAKELGNRRILWPILGAMSQIEKLRGDAAEAQKLAEEALEIVSFIADNIGIEEQRRSFLEQPDVQALMANQR